MIFQIKKKVAEIIKFFLLQNNLSSKLVRLLIVINIISFII
jgi:hypothetical protein